MDGSIGVDAEGVGVEQVPHSLLCKERRGIALDRLLDIFGGKTHLARALAADLARRCSGPNDAMDGSIDEANVRLPFKKEGLMADLLVIGYDEEETASKAAEEVYRLAHDLLIEPEAVAVIRRDNKGKFRVTTNHHPVEEGATWGMLWGTLFGLLFFIPIFGFAVGAAFGTLFGALERAGVNKEFQQEVRDMVRPGTSALFLIVDRVPSDKAIAALSKYGGRVLKSSLSSEAERRLQEALHGVADVREGRQTVAASPVS